MLLPYFNSKGVELEMTRSFKKNCYYYSALRCSWGNMYYCFVKFFSPFSVCLSHLYSLWWFGSIVNIVLLLLHILVCCLKFCAPYPGVCSRPFCFSPFHALSLPTFTICPAGSKTNPIHSFSLVLESFHLKFFVRLNSMYFIIMQLNHNSQVKDQNKININLHMI